jgi:hypothetical protein
MTSRTMSDTRSRAYAVHGSNPPADVPADQVAALDRRHALDAQQKAASAPSSSIPAPHWARSRPPG